MVGHSLYYVATSIGNVLNIEQIVSNDQATIENRNDNSQVDKLNLTIEEVIVGNLTDKEVTDDISALKALPRQACTLNCKRCLGSVC